MITKHFEKNSNGKIEFTEEELKKLLDEVYQAGKNDGKNGGFWWSSPFTTKDWTIKIGDDPAFTGPTTTNDNDSFYATATYTTKASSEPGSSTFPNENVCIYGAYGGTPDTDVTFFQ